MDNICISVCCPYCGRHHMRTIGGPFKDLLFYEVFICNPTLWGPGCKKMFMVEITLEQHEKVYKLTEAEDEHTESDHLPV